MFSSTHSSIIAGYQKVISKHALHVVKTKNRKNGKEGACLANEMIGRWSEKIKRVYKERALNGHERAK
jgi:hypothetical protein